MNGNGYTLVPNCVLDVEFLSAPEKLVIIQLLRYNGHKGTFPSVSLLSRKTRLHHTTVCRTLKTLEAKGLIQIEKGKGRKNHYTLTLEKVFSEPVAKETYHHVSNASTREGSMSRKQLVQTHNHVSKANTHGVSMSRKRIDHVSKANRPLANETSTNTKYKYEVQIHTKSTNKESVQEGKGIPSWQEEEDKPVDPKELERVFKEKPWLKEWYDRMLKLIREREKDERLRREWVKAEEVAQEAHRLLQKLYDDPVPPKDEEFYRRRKEEIRRQYRELVQQAS